MNIAVRPTTLLNTVLISLLLTFSVEGQCARFYSGHDLMQWVMEVEKMVHGEKYVSSDVFTLTGYVVGVADSDEGRGTLCFPKDIKVVNLMQAVSNYTRTHPEELHFGAYDLVKWSLLASFRCQNKSSVPSGPDNIKKSF